ncbi:MAG: ABC transporter permease [Symbiobacteriaceae bacterium]|nr:ABC transporter permease [Symbiobacteriaceae bacterium]
MMRYTLRRLLQSAVTVLVVVTTVFCMMRLMPLEGYIGESWDKLDATQRENRLRSLGVLDPLHIQLGRFYSQIFRGDLGVSTRYRMNIPITEIIAPRIPYSMQFGLAALFFSITIGCTLGLLMARRPDGLMDRFGTVYITLMQSVPLLVYVLIIQLYGSQWLRIPILYREDRPETWILPIVVGSIGGIAGYAVWMRRYMVDELNKDYIKLARAKGLSSYAIMIKHVLRNAFVPIAAYLPASILFTIGGSLIIEASFSIPGMGGLLVAVIQRQDNPTVQALILVFSTIGVIGLFLGDLLMGYLDPRIKLARSGGSR